MCGIFGAPDAVEFETLYDINKERGTHAFGSVTVTPAEDYLIHKVEGEEDFNKFLVNYPVRYVMGHTQAPTTCERDYKESTSHPFEVGDWFVAHNGIIDNFVSLKKEHVPWHTNNVDSSIIPALLNEGSNNESDNVKVIVDVLNKLTGTFAIWALHSPSSQIFVARCGSTLFFDPEKLRFSSISCKGWESAEEGKVFQYTTEGFTSVGSFNCAHPFFIL